MKIGLGLPQFGELGTPENIARLARFAEDENFDSVWVIERQLWPINPQTKYPPTPDGSFPTAYKKSLDPIETLTFVAAITKKIRLGTGAVDMLYQNPTVLAKRLATLDVLSKGRLLVGLALGHSKDEFQAVGVPFRNRGERADETLEILKKIWTSEIVEHQGNLFSIPQSKIGPKPIQRPHPPIYLAGFNGNTFDRIVRSEANGWLGIPLPTIDDFASNIRTLKETAKKVGRDPDSIELPTLIIIDVDYTSGKDRRPFHGTIQDVISDIKRIREIGVTELFMSFDFGRDGQDLDKTIEYAKTVKNELG
jgi:probable F420-dependent oxidoreductase